MSRARQCQRDGRILTGLSRLISGTTSLHPVGLVICSSERKIAFSRYLYGELINYTNGSAIRSILEASEKDSLKTQLKNHVSIHLLISGAPAGDAREFLPDDCDGKVIFQRKLLALHHIVLLQVLWLLTIWCRCEQRGHAPIYEHPEHGHLRYKLSIGMETIDADREWMKPVSCRIVI